MAFFIPGSAINEEYAERMGYDCEWNGADMTNCHFSLFAKPELTAAWERGKRRAEANKRTTTQGQPAKEE